MYAIATGIDYGMTVLAAVILLLNYFGRTNNLEIFTFVSLSGAVSAIAPFIGGSLRDLTGSFQAPFLLFAAINLLILVAAAMMRPPRPGPAPTRAEIADAEAKLAASID